MNGPKFVRSTRLYAKANDEYEPYSGVLFNFPTHELTKEIQIKVQFKDFKSQIKSNINKQNQQLENLLTLKNKLAECKLVSRDKTDDDFINK